MALFTLEALEARHGDCLILHYGDEGQPRFILIDGGPGRVYAENLRPRLEELRKKWTTDEPLPLEMVMVSHIDDDHINGVLDLTNDLLRRDEDDRPYEILSFWHNSFDEILGNTDEDIFSELDPGVKAASAGGAPPPDMPGLERHKAAVAASVGQGRQLRANVEKLDLDINHPYKGLVLADLDEIVPIDMGDGLTFTVLGPDLQRVKDLHAKWEKELAKAKKKEAAAAAYQDESVFNLSSIVVLVEFGGKRMLLTGDARGDDTLKALRAAKLLKDDKIHVDILKLPHHGSDRNVDTDYFETIRADHYVASGDGEFGNPEVATLEMLSQARPDDDFTLHLTNRDGKKGLGEKLKAFFDKEKNAGRKYSVVFRDEDKRSVKIDLLKPVNY